MCLHTLHAVPLCLFAKSSQFGGHGYRARLEYHGASTCTLEKITLSALKSTLVWFVVYDHTRNVFHAVARK